MRKIMIDQLPVGSKLEDKLYHISGSILHKPGETIEEKNINLLKKHKISFVIKLDPTDIASEFVFKARNKTIIVKEIEEDTVLTNALYTKEGTLLLDAGKKISVSIKNKLLNQGIDHLYVQRTPDELGIYNVKAYKNEVTAAKEPDVPNVNFSEDDEHKNEIVLNESVRNSKISDENMMNPLEDLSVQYVDDFIEGSYELDTSPAGIALEKSIVRRDPMTSRTEIEKVDYLRSFNDIVGISKKLFRVFAQIMNSKSGNVETGKIEDFSRKIIDALVRDKDMLLNLLHRDRNFKALDYIVEHSMNVCAISVNIATAMGYSADQILEIAYGAFLSDIGMLKVPEKILTKPGKLTQGELLELQKHPGHSVDLLKKITKIPKSAPIIVYQAHERCDGSGYPKSRKSIIIHKYSKIISVADVYDALITKKPWRPSMHPYEAIKEILHLGNKNKLDVDVIRGFLKYNSVYPIGCFVQLSNGKRGKVVSANETDYTRPVIKLMNFLQGKWVEDGFIDLKVNREITVTNVLKPDYSNKNILVGF